MQREFGRVGTGQSAQHGGAQGPVAARGESGGGEQQPQQPARVGRREPREVVVQREGQGGGPEAFEKVEHAQGLCLDRGGHARGVPAPPGVPGPRGAPPARLRRRRGSLGMPLARVFQPVTAWKSSGGGRATVSGAQPGSRRAASASPSPAAAPAAAGRPCRAPSRDDHARQLPADRLRGVVERRLVGGVGHLEAVRDPEGVSAHEGVRVGDAARDPLGVAADGGRDDGDPRSYGPRDSSSSSTGRSGACSFTRRASSRMRWGKGSGSRALSRLSACRCGVRSMRGLCLLKRARRTGFPVHGGGPGPSSETLWGRGAGRLDSNQRVPVLETRCACLCATAPPLSPSVAAPCGGRCVRRPTSAGTDGIGRCALSASRRRFTLVAMDCPARTASRSRRAGRCPGDGGPRGCACRCARGRGG